MTNYGKVYGAAEPPKIEITPRSVFVATNIEPYAKAYEDGYVVSGYIYNYVEYSTEEYIRLLGETNERLESALLDTQAALCDLYEMIDGGLV